MPNKITKFTIWVIRFSVLQCIIALLGFAAIIGYMVFFSIMFHLEPATIKYPALIGMSTATIMSFVIGILTKKYWIW